MGEGHPKAEVVCFQVVFMGLITLWLVNLANYIGGEK